MSHMLRKRSGSFTPHNHEHAPDLSFNLSSIGTISESNSLQEQKDIDSNIVTTQRTELIKTIDNDQSKSLVPAYIRIEALNVHDLHIPTEIVDYIILYIYYEPSWDKSTTRRDRIEYLRINQNSAEEYDQLFNTLQPITISTITSSPSPPRRHRSISHTLSFPSYLNISSNMPFSIAINFPSLEQSKKESTPINIAAKRVELMKTMDKRRHLLVFGYIRIEAYTRRKLYIPSEIIEFIVLYRFYIPESERQRRREAKREIAHYLMAQQRPGRAAKGWTYEGSMTDRFISHIEKDLFTEPSSIKDAESVEEISQDSEPHSVTTDTLNSDNVRKNTGYVNTSILADLVRESTNSTMELLTNSNPTLDSEEKELIEDEGTLTDDKDTIEPQVNIIESNKKTESESMTEIEREITIDLDDINVNNKGCACVVL